MASRPLISPKVLRRNRWVLVGLVAVTFVLMWIEVSWRVHHHHHTSLALFALVLAVGVFTLVWGRRNCIVPARELRKARGSQPRQ